MSERASATKTAKTAKPAKPAKPVAQTAASPPAKIAKLAPKAPASKVLSKKTPAKASAKKPEAKSARPSAKAPGAPKALHAIFLPTLLPDPFGESSPELCWEWRGDESRLTLRLTQFGWNASAFSNAGALHWNDDQLVGLRAQVCQSSLPAPMQAAMARPWILAYETANL